MPPPRATYTPSFSSVSPVSSVVESFGSFAPLPRGQATPQRQPDRLVYRDPHDAGVLGHPPIAPQRGILAGTKLLQVLARSGLQPWLRRCALTLRDGHRIRRRHTSCLARREVAEEQPDEEMDADRDHDKRNAETKHRADVDVARLVVDLRILARRAGLVGKVQFRHG